MKIYLAAPYAGRDILKDDLDWWTANGHEVTCGWVRGTRPLETASFGISVVSTDEEVAAHAEMDLADIDEADALVHYTADYLVAHSDWGRTEASEKNLHSGGRHVETGYALAKGKPVVILGPKENIFQRGLCLEAHDLDDALSALLIAERFL